MYSFILLHGSSKLMSILANGLLNLAKTVANIRGRKMIHTIDGNVIHTKFKKLNSNSNAYDTKTFKNCQLMVKGYSNPIFIKKTNEELEKLDFISSTRYKQYMKQKAIKEAFTTSLYDERLFYLIAATLGTTIIFGLVITFMVS